jgi:myo-inositol 2-dehydrogenase/D-chiro-inositol 1-dehydrogenase
MRIGIIGTGGIASHHMEALAAIPSAQVVAVAGRDPARAEALARPRGAVAYGDWQAMLARERLDAAYICLPPRVAAEVARGCAGQVGALMVEKPVASDLPDAQRTLVALRQAGTLAGAAYHNRVRAIVPRISQLCATQPPVIAEAYWHGEMPPPPWWRSRAMSGGQMTEQATHLIDLLRVWVGEAAEVTAVAARGTMAREIEGFDVDDAVSSTIRFASGAIATVHVSCVAKTGQGLGGGVGMTLRARGWEARLAGWGLDTHIRHEGGRDETFAAEPEIFQREAEAFLTAVSAGDASRLPCTYQDAVNTLALTCAIDEAARTGLPQRVRPVSV